MIKLFHVFDKTLGMDFSGEDGHNQLKILMEDSLSEIDLDDLPCPSCGYRPVQWKHRYTRTSMFIWDSINSPVPIIIPAYQHFCSQCKTSGIETISTDITIGKTNLSYHYLFGLFRNKRYPTGKTIYDLHNLLYGKLSEESLKRWFVRFQTDFGKSGLFLQVNQDEFLAERMPYGDFFLQFYDMEGRCFLEESRTKMIIYEADERRCYIRNSASLAK